MQGLIYQFQRDVHEACSVQLGGGAAGGGGGGGGGAAERPESELAAILKYMVAGRGWMILHVINALPATVGAASSYYCGVLYGYPAT